MMMMSRLSMRMLLDIDRLQRGSRRVRLRSREGPGKTGDAGPVETGKARERETVSGEIIGLEESLGEVG